MLNKIILNGRLVSDIREVNEGKIGFLTLAVQRNYKNKEGKYDTDFVDIAITGEKAVASWKKNFQKGDGVVIVGEVHTRKFDRAKAGEKVKEALKEAGIAKISDEVVAKIVSAVQPNSNELGIRCSFPEFGTVSKKYRDGAASASSTGEPEFVSADDDFEIGSDDDLPF
jgi:single-stranded DNA-binding protein